MWHQPQVNKYSLLWACAEGLLEYKKLPYGVASAPVVLQRMMDRVLSQLHGVISYLGESGRDHM